MIIMSILTRKGKKRHFHKGQRPMSLISGHCKDDNLDYSVLK